MSVDFDKIRRLVGLVEQNHLTELSVEEEGLSVTVKARLQGEAAPPPVSYESCPPEPEAAPAARVEAEPVNENLVQIKSPMIGVFYRCPSPDSPPYAEVGDEIEEGQTIGLIEAMKVFSEVPSEVAGRVVSLPVGNGKLVQQDDVLAVIDTAGVG